MEFILKIDTDNDAFSESKRVELARILKKLAAKLADDVGSDLDGGKVMDVNGNSVGRWEIRA